MPYNETVSNLGLEEYKYGFITEGKPVFKARKGLNEEVVRQISAHKDEPEWMLKFRLKALEIFRSKPMPTWGGDLSQLDATLDEIYYYIRPQDRMGRSWEDVPQEIKDTFEKLGIPEAERKILAGVGAQYESENGLPLAEEGVGGEGDHLRLDRGWPEEPSGAVPRVLLDGDSARRQQVRRAELGGVVGRVVRLHPAGREGGDAAAGVLPRERGADGAVRAHADHRQ